MLTPTGTDRPKVLIADDLAENRELLRQTVEPEGYDALLVPSGEVALPLACKLQPDLILLDFQMPGGWDGLETCERLKAEERTRHIPIIFITVMDDAQSLIQAFQHGAVDYIVKPFVREEVRARVRAHVALCRLRRELEQKNEELLEEVNRRRRAEGEAAKAQEGLDDAGQRLSVLTEQQETWWGVTRFVGKSPTINRILAQIKRLQETESVTALITGESGTGKELIARAIHHGGTRSKGSFIPLNCAAIPRDLAESTLFGHVKGAFSGAIRNSKGYFEMACGGTLVLDEVGELPLEMQGKFLRVLEERSFIPIGGTESRKVDVRLVAATNRDLGLRVQQGLFREDLFFRLSRYVIEAPPLRERREDLPLLAAHFLDLLSSEMKRPCLTLDPEAMELIQAHAFPGNIRELKNLLERAVIECSGDRILPEHLHFMRLQAPLLHRDPTMPTEEQRLRAAGGESAATRLEEESVLKFIHAHGSVSNSECRDLLKTNIDRAYYLLNRMQKAGLIRRVGEHRAARYLPL